ncbi:MAG: hypothetical protein JWP27_1950, partial [Flaviaesturariibacter sp.]|nr:hypothetical protein [Flaviaesturariibacter sp.]
MKNIILSGGAFLLLAAILFPRSATAQSTDREFYLRPSYWRPYDQRGLNVYESAKVADTIPYEGLRIRFGAGFTQQYQNLKHTNTAVNNGAANKLYPLTSG